MEKSVNLNHVRNTMKNYVGSKVKIRLNKGRHRIVVEEGIISEAYPNIFLLKIKNESEGTFRNESYSYQDLLTKDIQLTLY